MQSLNKILQRTKTILSLLAFLSVLVFIAVAANHLEHNSPLYMPNANEIKADISYLSAQAKGRIHAFQKRSSPNYTKDFTQPLVDDEETIYGKAVQISIPSVGIDLNVLEGSYDNDSKEWTIDDGVAFWANLSDLPSNLKGNTLIYAHNRTDAFYYTKNMKKGDLIILTLEDGSQLTYEYFDDEIVSPENSSVFQTKDIPRLTLLTCNGDMSLKRRLIYAKLVDATPANNNDK